MIRSLPGRFRRSRLWACPRLFDPPLRFSWPAALGFAALCMLLSYPGRLNGDSLYSLMTAALPGMANNWHSATLVWFWSLPAPLLGQPPAALTMQAALFGLFAGFLPRLPPTPRGRAALAGELLLRAALAGAAGDGGKDAVMLLTLLIAVQLLRGLARRPLSVAGAVLLAVAALLFLLAKAPDFLVIVVAAALLLPFFLRAPPAYPLLVAGALAVGVLAIPLNRAVDAHVFGARDLHPDKQLVLFDLAGISAGTGRDAFAAVPGWPAATLPPVSGCYVPWMWDSFAHWTPCGGYAVAYNRFDRALTRHWLAQIAAHPLAYLQHRLRYLGYLLGSRDHDSWGLGGRSANDATDPAALATLRAGMADVGVTRAPPLWHPSPVTAPLRWLERGLLAWPMVQWAALLACLTVLLAGWLRRREGVRIGALLAAALGAGNVAMLAVFGVADPGRYLLPTVALAWLALLALLAPAVTGSAPPGIRAR